MKDEPSSGDNWKIIVDGKNYTFSFLPKMNSNFFFHIKNYFYIISQCESGCLISEFFFFFLLQSLSLYYPKQMVMYI